jgi:hypothetical protein
MSRDVPRDRTQQIHLATDALNARDFEALATVFHPELEHHSVFAAVEGEIYRGIEGQRKPTSSGHALGSGLDLAPGPGLADRHVQDPK